jgi:hypothetical protein
MSDSVIRVNFDASTNKELFKKLIEGIFDNTDREALKEYPNMFKVQKSEDEYIRKLRMAGLPLGGEVKEGENIPIYAPKYGGTKDWTQKSFGLGFRVTDRMKRFNKWDLMAKFTKSLKKSQVETKDVELAKVWNNLTASTYATGYDGFVIGYDSHTCLDSSATVYDNLLGSALSNAALESALNYFDYLYDDQAQITTAKPDTLYVNYSLRISAAKILRSDNVSGEQSNTINVFPDWALKTFVYHRLTSSTAWGVLAKNDDNFDINVWTAMEPDLKVKDACDQTRDTVVDSLQYFAYGCGDPRLAYCGNV